MNTCGSGRALHGERKRMVYHTNTYFDHLLRTLIQTASLALMLWFLLSSLTVMLQVYTPSSWTVRGLMVRLILIPWEKVNWEMVYCSAVMSLGPLHVAVITSPVFKLQCRVVVHVRLRVVPVYREVLRLREMFTSGTKSAKMVKCTK